MNRNQWVRSPSSFWSVVAVFSAVLALVPNPTLAGGGEGPVGMGRDAGVLLGEYELRFTVNPINVEVGEPFHTEVVVFNKLVGAVERLPGVTVVLELDDVPGGAVVSGGEAETDSQGRAVFPNVIVDTEDPHAFLIASATNMDDGVSQAFPIGGGGPRNSVLFVAQPSDVAPSFFRGVALSTLRVCARDPGGLPIPDARLTATPVPFIDVDKLDVLQTDGTGCGQWAMITPNDTTTGLSFQIRLEGEADVLGTTEPIAIVEPPPGFHFEFQTSPPTPFVMEPFTVTVQAKDGFGGNVENVFGNFNIEIFEELNFEAGNRASLQQQVVPLQNGAASLEGVVVLHSSSIGVAVTTTAPMTIGFEPGVTVNFNPQPQDKTAGEEFSVVPAIDIRDPQGTVMTDVDQAICLRVPSNDGDGFVSEIRQFNGGNIVLDGLAITRAALARTLRAELEVDPSTFALTRGCIASPPTGDVVFDVESLPFDVLPASPQQLSQIDTGVAPYAGCSVEPAQFQSHDAFGNISGPQVSVEYGLSSTSLTRVFYSDANCQTPVTELQVGAGQATVDVYFSDTSLTDDHVQVTTPFTTLTGTVGLEPGGIAFSPLSFTTPAAVCSAPITISLDHQGSPYALVEDVDVIVWSPNTTTMSVFADADCTTALDIDLSAQTDTLALTQANPTQTFYVRDTTPTGASPVALYVGDPLGETFVDDAFALIGVAPLVADGLNFFSSPSIVTAGEAFSTEVEATLQGSRTTAWTEDIDLSYAARPTGAPDLNAFATPALGVATFDNLVATVAGAYTLRAVSGEGDFLVADSPELTVVPAAPVSLDVVPDSSTAFLNACSEPIRVRAFDSFGNAYFTTTSTPLVFEDVGAGNFGIYATLSACNADAAAQDREAVALAAGETEATFYVKSNAEGAFAFRTSLAGIGPVETTIAVTNPIGARLQIDGVDEPIRIGSPFALQASVRDAGGALLSWPAVVEVELGQPAPGTLAGTLSQVGGDGNLLFDDLTLDAVGAYVLIVRSGTLTAEAAVTATPGLPAAIAFQTAAHAPSENACSGEVRFAVVDLQGNSAFLDGSEVATLSANPPTVDLFADALCTVPLLAPRHLPLSSGEGVFSFRSSLVGGVTTAVTVADAEGSQTHTVVPDGADLPTTLVVSGAQAPLLVGTCSGPVTYALFDEDGLAASLPSESSLTLTTNRDDVSFFTGGNCETAIDDAPVELPLAAGIQEGVVSFMAADVGEKTLTFAIPGIPQATLDRVVEADGGNGPIGFRFETPPRVAQVGTCSPPVRISLVNSDGAPTGFSTATTVSFATSSVVDVFQDACGETPLEPGTGIALEAGVSEFTLRFQAATVVETDLVVSGPGLTSASQLLKTQEDDVEPPSLAFRFDTAPFSGAAGVCAQGIRIVLEDEAGDATTLEEDLTIAVSSSSGTVTLFAAEPANACDVPPLNGGQLTLPAGQSQVSFHFVDLEAGTMTIYARADGIDEISQEHSLTAAALAAPQIAREANAAAAVGVNYIYGNERVAEVVIGTPQVTWSAPVAPNGFLINAQTGFVTWVPAASQVGPQEVMLRAANPQGEDTYSFTINVLSEEDIADRERPVAVINIEDDSDVGPAALRLRANADGSTSADEDPSETNFTWDYGDGSTRSAARTALRNYTLPGSYVLRLAVQDSVGLLDEATHVVSVFDGAEGPPKAQIRAEVVNEGEESTTMRFTCDCAAGTTPIVSYRWEFENDLQSSSEEVTQVFGLGGHVVRLTVADENGLVATDTYEVVVATPFQTPPLVTAVADPVAATLTPGGQPVVVTFRALYGDADGTVVAVRWIEDDQVFANTPTTTRTYTDIGTYEVQFEAEDDDGLVTTRLLTVRVTTPDGSSAPEIVSVPNQTATVGQPYAYSDDGRVIVRGSRPLSFQLGFELNGEIVGRPEGMRIDPTTGTITWAPEATSGSKVDVAIVVSNQLPGGTQYFDIQDFVIELEGGIDPEPDGSIEECACSDARSSSTSHPSGTAVVVLLALGVGLRRRRQSAVGRRDLR